MRKLGVPNSLDVVVTLNAESAICVRKHVVYLAFGKWRSGAPLALCGYGSVTHGAQRLLRAFHLIAFPPSAVHQVIK